MVEVSVAAASGACTQLRIPHFFTASRSCSCVCSHTISGCRIALPCHHRRVVCPRPAAPRTQMRHVGAAIAEMFSTGHVRLLREACRLERLLLGALYLELSSRWVGEVFVVLGGSTISTCGWLVAAQATHLLSYGTSAAGCQLDGFACLALHP